MSVALERSEAKVSRSVLMGGKSERIYLSRLIHMDAGIMKGTAVRRLISYTSWVKLVWG